MKILEFIAPLTLAKFPFFDEGQENYERKYKK